jgi:Family of unknown function (DUF6544)
LKHTHHTLPATVAGAAVADMDETWECLAQPTASPPGFESAMTESLPEPARRWLNHAITPGQPVARAVIVDMRGNVRLGRWIGFRAVQVIAPPAGFVWAARVRWGPWWLGRHDRCSDATGEMRSTPRWFSVPGVSVASSISTSFRGGSATAKLA